MYTLIKKIAVSFIAVSLTFGAQANTLKMAYDADPVSLDPHEQLSGGTLQLSHMVFDPLVRWTQDLQFEARLAESWERLGKLTFRFKLRSGVKFHSGNTLTATDVCWTYDRLNKSPDFKGLFEPFASCNVVDDLTVDLKHTNRILWCYTKPLIYSPWTASFTAAMTTKATPRTLLPNTAILSLPKISPAPDRLLSPAANKACALNLIASPIIGIKIRRAMLKKSSLRRLPMMPRALPLCCRAMWILSHRCRRMI